MVKRKKIKPEESDDEQDVYVPEEGSLTYTMRYIVGVLKPEQSSEGSECYGLFFETEKFIEAKKEAEKAFKEDNLEVVIWDRDKWSSDGGSEVARYVPETVKDDNDADAVGTGAEKTPRRRAEKIPRGTRESDPNTRAKKRSTKGEPKSLVNKKIPPSLRTKRRRS